MSSKRLFVAGLSLALIASPALAQSSGTLELGALGSYTKFDSEYLKIDDQFAATTTGHVMYDISKATA